MHPRCPGDVAELAVLAWEGSSFCIPWYGEFDSKGPRIPIPLPPSHKGKAPLTLDSLVVSLSLNPPPIHYENLFLAKATISLLHMCLKKPQISILDLSGHLHFKSEPF